MTKSSATPRVRVSPASTVSTCSGHKVLLTGHPEQGLKPREKLSEQGAQALSDTELLAVLLGTGLPGIPVLTLAERLITHFGGLSALMHAQHEQLKAMPGIGLARFARIAASMELCRRTVFETLSRDTVLSRPQDVRDYLAMQIAALEHEVFCALFLDNRHRVIEFRRLFTGTIDCASVYPREVVKQCLSINAAAVIFAHNHPSGMAEPSEADVSITLTLKEALELIDVRVLDHWVIGAGTQTSLAERGLI